MSSIRSRVALCALMLPVLSCAGEQRNEVAVNQAELDLDAGAVEGTVLWNGAPLSVREADGLYANEGSSIAISLNASAPAR
jgi:hypothetical protein